MNPKKPWEASSVYAWSVDELPEIIRVGEDVMLVLSKDLVHVFAMPQTKLNDVLKILHEHVPQLGYVPMELMANDRSTPPAAEGGPHD